MSRHRTRLQKMRARHLVFDPSHPLPSLAPTSPPKPAALTGLTSNFQLADLQKTLLYSFLVLAIEIALYFYWT